MRVAVSMEQAQRERVCDKHMSVASDCKPRCRKGKATEYSKAFIEYLSSISKLTTFEIHPLTPCILEHVHSPVSLV